MAESSLQLSNGPSTQGTRESTGGKKMPPSTRASRESQELATVDRGPLADLRKLGPELRVEASPISLQT